MNIESIRLRDFRNYQELKLNPDPGINLIFGPNGSGKTNILEAIHFCALGKSHRVANDQHAVRSGMSFAQCRLSVRSKTGVREITVNLTPEETPRKTILIDGKKIRRFSDMMGCLQNVIFSPEDLDMVREGPSLRRRYLDMMISQVSRSYFIALQQYRAGMEQRNMLLKSCRLNPGADRGMMEDFERAMAEPAAVIIRQRRGAVERLSGLVEETYAGISGREEEKFTLEYHSSLQDADDIAGRLAQALRENRENDIRLGMTTSGPHRDDLNLTLNRKSLKLFASQGQIRTAALSMKLAQMKLLREISGENPVLLLDDVMSELDNSRRQRLLEEIRDYQTFLTGTDESDLAFEKTGRIYEIHAEEGLAAAFEKNRDGELVSPAEEKTAENTAEPDFSMPEADCFM